MRGSFARRQTLGISREHAMPRLFRVSIFRQGGEILASERRSRRRFRSAQAPGRRTQLRSKSTTLTALRPSSRMLCALRSAWSTPAM